MTTADQRALREMGRTSDILAERLVQLATLAKVQRATGFRIPVLDADPDADDLTNLWLLNDGRLRARDADGDLHEFRPYNPATAQPAIPTFSSDPAASTGWRLWFNGGSGELRGRLANGNVVRYAPIVSDTSSDGGTPGDVGDPTSGTPKPSDPAPSSHRKVYSATWARTFCARHGVETGDKLYYGTYSATHGERKIMVGFDDAVIRADLAGGDIRMVRLKWLNTHSWSYSGIDIHVGAHNQSSAPGSFTASRKDVWIGHWPNVGYGGDKHGWHKSTTWFGRALRDHTATGLTIDQPTGLTSYGQLDWSTVQIEITYVS